MRVAVGRHLNRPQVADEIFGVAGMELSCVPNRALLEEAPQVLGSRSVSIDGFYGRSQDLFVMLEPELAKRVDGNWLEAECGRSADGELAIDLCCELSGRFQVRANPRAMTSALFVVAKVPALTTKEGLDFSDAKRTHFRHVILRESSRYKMPQKLPQTGKSEDRSERQRLI